MRGRRCGCSPSCCRTRSGCWAATTPITLTTRNNIASWTGEVGDAREALRLFTELLPDQERVLGRDHPDTLITRSNIASWTGRVGDAREALRLFTELLPDQERVLGRDHPDTLSDPQQHRGLDRRGGRFAGGAAAVHRAAAGPGAGAGPRPPRHAQYARWIGILAIRYGDRAEGCRWLHEGLRRAEHASIAIIR